MACRGCGRQRQAKPSTAAKALMGGEDKMDWPIVRFVGERKGGFTQHGPTTRGYRFSPPYTTEVRMHPEDAVALAATGEYQIVWPEAPAPRPTVVSPTLATDQIPVQKVADGIKLAARRAAIVAAQDVQAARAIAAQQPPALRAPAQVNDPVPAPIIDSVHPAVAAMRRGYNEDQAAKMGTPAASPPAPTPAVPRRLSGPPGALRPADRPPPGAQLWQPA